MLRVARALGARSNRSTCAPRSWAPMPCRRNSPAAPDDYIDEVLRMLPPLHEQGLVDAVDAFCERIAFSPAQTERVFAGRARGSACRSSCMPSSSATAAARSWPRATARSAATTWSGSAKRAPPRWRRQGPWRCCCPARSISCAKRALPPVDAAAPARRADGGVHRLQSGQLALHLAAADAEHGLHAVQADARGGPGRRDAQCGAARWACRIAACWPRACAPTSCCGTSQRPAQLSYAMGFNPHRQTVFWGRAAMSFILNRGTAPLLVSMPHIGTDIPPGAARRLRAARAGRGRHGLAPGRAVRLPAGAGRQRAAAALLALCDRPEPAAGRRADVPRRVEHRAVPDPLLQRRAAVPRGREPSPEERPRRRETYWQPYHQALRRRTRSHQGRARLSCCCGTRTASAPRFRGCSKACCPT